MNIETADRLIALRKRKGLSQEELAEALGISRQAVSKWERAESSPDVDNAILLSRLYNISLDELFGNKPEYEIELDSMEPDQPAEEEASPAEENKEGAFEDTSFGFPQAEEQAAEGGLGAMISCMVNDAMATAREAVQEAQKAINEVRADEPAGRAVSIPANARPIADANYEGIRSLVCSARADLHIIGTEGDICSVSCSGPEKEKARCFVYTEGDALHIVTDDAKKRFFFGIGGRINLKIEVVLPAAKSIDVGLKGGDLTLDGVRAELINAKTGGGDIGVSGCSVGELNIKTGGGDVEVRSSDAKRAEIICGGGEINAEDFDAEALLSLRTGGGDIELSGSAKCVEATTGGGDIELDVKAEGVNAKTGGGDIGIRCSGVKYVGAKTGGGDIKATLVGCTGITADLASAGGEASVDYKNEACNTGRKLSFTAGDGSALLEMRSGGGDIEVKAE